MGRGLIAIALSSAVGACSSSADPVAFALVTQDKNDFQTCKEALDARKNWADKLQTMSKRMEKNAETSSGFIVNVVAYQSEFVQIRGSLTAAERAIARNNCEPKSP